MKFVIQRCQEASVTVGTKVVGSISRGFTVLIGVSNSDDKATADRLIRKLLNLRIFEDSGGKTNISLKDIGGSLLLISQFTLYADCRRGNRPSFIRAGQPDKANRLYEYIIDRCHSELAVWNNEKGTDIYKVESGVFGADMKVSLINDGPFTIILDSDEI